VFKFAVKVLAKVAHEALDASKLPASDRLAGAASGQRPHHGCDHESRAAAGRMVSTVALRQHIGGVDPLALDVAVRDGRIRSGHHVMLVGIGGFTCSVLLKWT
jgi:3-oxoacyl-[acyl-carrier-protein] synthase-3